MISFAVACVLAAEIVVYFLVYRSRYGRSAVYRSPYAWVIDLLALISGCTIATASIFSLAHPELFTVEMNASVFWLCFFFGSSQAVMHIVKWFIRMFFSK